MDTPTGVYDLSDLAEIPGILPLQTAPQDVVDAVNGLAQQYAAGVSVSATRPDNVAQTNGTISAGGSSVGTSDDSSVASDPLAPPPPMDSGDPNPDRLNAPSLIMSIPQPDLPPLAAAQPDDEVAQ